MRIALSRLGLTALLLSIVIAALAGCQQAIEPGNPSLPVGFSETPILDVDLNGYIYVKQREPLRLSSNYFVAGADTSSPFAGVRLPPQVNLDRITVVQGPSIGSFGATIEFSSGSDADATARVIEQYDLWTTWSDRTLTLITGTDEWAQSVRDAVEQDRRATLQESYPEIWEVIRLLPENPPAPPVAAGFLRVEKSTLEALATKANIGLGNASQAMGVARFNDIAFAVYAERPLQIPEEIDESFLRESGVGAVWVARSGYPSFVVSIVLNVLGGRIGLTETSIDDTGVRYMTIQDLHLYIANQGNIIYGALAPDKAQAEALMLSALGK